MEDIVQGLTDTLMYFGLWRGLLAILTIGLAYIMGWTWMTWWRVWVEDQHRKRLTEH